MPRFCQLFCVCLLSGSQASASIDYMEQGFYSEESFTRISEYFDGVEVSGNRIIFRSNPDFRTGHYVTFQISKNYPIDHFKLEVFEYGSKEPRDYIYRPDSAIPTSKPIFLGLTGEQWLEKTRPPVAYKLSLIARDGSTLVSKTSFLWGDD